MIQFNMLTSAAAVCGCNLLPEAQAGTGRQETMMDLLLHLVQAGTSRHKQA